MENPKKPQEQSKIPEPQPHLERRLGLLNATSINMSNMVGTDPLSPFRSLSERWEDRKRYWAGS
jgi:hypothetical protein